jgi:hypothetical protein
VGLIQRSGTRIIGYHCIQDLDIFSITGQGLQINRKIEGGGDCFVWKYDYGDKVLTPKKTSSVQWIFLQVT